MLIIDEIPKYEFVLIFFSDYEKEEDNGEGMMTHINSVTSYLTISPFFSASPLPLLFTPSSLSFKKHNF